MTSSFPYVGIFPIKIINSTDVFISKALKVIRDIFFIHTSYVLIRPHHLPWYSALVCSMKNNEGGTLWYCSRLAEMLRMMPMYVLLKAPMHGQNNPLQNPKSRHRRDFPWIALTATTTSSPTSRSAWRNSTPTTRWSEDVCINWKRPFCRAAFFQFVVILKKERKFKSMIKR
mgnify:CR=1 FL=1